MEVKRGYVYRSIGDHEHLWDHYPAGMSTAFLPSVKQAKVTHRPTSTTHITQTTGMELNHL
jgi:hypothetical protein